MPPSFCSSSKQRPQVVATIQRYLQRLSAFRAPTSVDVAETRCASSRWSATQNDGSRVHVADDYPGGEVRDPCVTAVTVAAVWSAAVRELSRASELALSEPGSAW